MNLLEFKTSGTIKGDFDGTLLLDGYGLPSSEGLGGTAKFDFNIDDLKTFFETPANGIVFPTVPEFKPLNLTEGVTLSFLKVLTSNPETAINVLREFLETLEDATLGKNGIISKYPIPLIGDAIGQVLRAGKADNFIGILKSNLIPRIEEYLNSKADVDNFAALFAEEMTKLLRDVKLIPETEEKGVLFYCFQNNGQDKIDCDDTEKVESVEWLLPIERFECIDLPLDLRMDTNFPFSFGLSGADEPQLCFCLSFNFGFGFDQIDGFYLQTESANEEESEISVTAFLHVPPVNEAVVPPKDSKVRAQILFLEAEAKRFEVIAGVGVFVNVVNPNKNDQKDSRLTAADFKKARLRDLVKISGVIGAGLDLGEVSLFVEGFNIIDKFIPKLSLEGGVQFRQEFSFFNDGSTPSGAQRQLAEYDGDRESGASTSTFPSLHPLIDHVVEDDGSVRRHLLHETDRAKKRRLGPGTIRNRILSTPKAVPVSDVDFDKLVDIRHHHDHAAVPLLYSVHKALGEERRRTRLLRRSEEINCEKITNEEFFKDDNFAENFSGCKLLSGSDHCAEIRNIAVTNEAFKGAIEPLVSKFVNNKDNGYLDKIAQPLLELEKEIKPLSNVLQFEVTILSIAETYLGKEKSGADTVRLILEVYKNIKALSSAAVEGYTLASKCDLLIGFKCSGGDFPKTLDPQSDNEDKPVRRPFPEGDKKFDGLSIPFMDEPLLLLDLLQGKSITLVRFRPPPVRFGME